MKTERKSIKAAMRKKDGSAIDAQPVSSHVKKPKRKRFLNPDATGVDGVFMYTAAAVSPGVTAGELLFSVITLTLVYAVILVIELFLMVKYVRGGVAASMPELGHHPDAGDDTDPDKRDDVLAFAY